MQQPENKDINLFLFNYDNLVFDTGCKKEKCCKKYKKKGKSNCKNCPKID